MNHPATTGAFNDPDRAADRVDELANVLDNVLTNDEVGMRRAAQLAVRGEGAVEPNPMVGAVIADASGRVVGEGWHQRFGGPHAEVHALQQAGDLARGGTLYCTLEPCCHFGKTPPCADAIIAAGIRRCVVGMVDPFPKVAGGGIRKLQQAGIDVTVGVLASECAAIAAPFVTRLSMNRPFVIAKWAMTLDGKLAARGGVSKWISNDRSRTVVHALRGRCDAILAGIGTVLADDPLLTARPSGLRVPLRVVLDATARLPLDSQLVKTASESPVLLAVSSAAAASRISALRSAGVEVLVVEPVAEHGNEGDGNEEHGNVQTAALSGAQPGGISLPSLLATLSQRGVTNLLVEGGGRVLGSFRDLALMDEVHAFIAPTLLGGAAAVSPIQGFGADSPANGLRLSSVDVQSLDGDVYIRGRVIRVAEQRC